MIRPYYETEFGKLYQGNCLDVLSAIEAGSVDLIITDPPYGVTALEWDICVAWQTVALDRLSPNGSLWCFGSLRFFMECAVSFKGWRYAQEVVWEKHNGSNPHADRFRRVHELITQFYPADVLWRDVYKKPVYTLNATAKTVRRKIRPAHFGNIGNSSYTSVDGGPKLMRSVIYARSCHGIAEHPTQKPVEIIEPLIKFSSPKDALILDPFFGSGTTAIACERLGRRWIGIEISKEYCDIAIKRIERERAQLKLDLV